MSELSPEDQELVNENPPEENPYVEEPGDQENFEGVLIGDDPDVDFVEVEE